jgi:hypothetical protein
VHAAIDTHGHGSALTAARREDVAALTEAWRKFEAVVGGEYLQVARSGQMATYLEMRTSQVKSASLAVNEALTRLEEAEVANAAGSDGIGA